MMLGICSVKYPEWQGGATGEMTVTVRGSLLKPGDGYAGARYSILSIFAYV